jgi:hypothetical protein
LKDLYVASIMAWTSRQHEIVYDIKYIITSSDDEARGYFRRVNLESNPVAQGYHDHFERRIKFPNDWIKKEFLLNEMSESEMIEKLVELEIKKGGKATNEY